MDNIDVIISELGYEIGTHVEETIIQKCLGVLANDGVYAYYVYVISDSKAKNKKNYLIDKTLEKIKDYISNNETDSQKYFQKLSEDLQNLLFFRQLLERSLIYARYHAKAFSGDTQS